LGARGTMPCKRTLRNKKTKTTWLDKGARLDGLLKLLQKRNLAIKGKQVYLNLGY